MNPPENPEDAAGRWSEEMADMRELAGNIWRFYDELTKAGFKEEQAFGLTLAMLTSMISKN